MDLNHTIVWSSDQKRSATFMAEMLGRPAPGRLGPFETVALDNGLSLLFMDADGPIQAQHYAFLTSEAEFDAIFERLRSKGLTVDEDDLHVNALGIKGVGEIGVTGTAGAVANAVWHATGVRVREAPITLDKLL